MHVQYPPGTEYVYSYIESRGGKIPSTVFFGLQGFIKEYLSTPITKADIDEAEEIMMAHVGVFNRAGWEYILEVHNGYMPVEINAVPEGSVVPVGNVLLSIVNTDPKCFWLTTFLETALLRAIWYPTTIASQGYQTKLAIKEYLEKTGSLDSLDYKLVDFGARGVSSLESSGIGGTAHLLNFMSTDNVAALVYAKKYYGCDMAGYSVPAMEHSTVTSWGREHEIDSYSNMIEQYKDFPIVSCVSDSYDIFEACHMVGRKLKDKIIESGMTYVIRPDSGDPCDVIGRCLDILIDYFGYVTNDKGYRVLNNVKVLWGDGINHDSILEIMEYVKNLGYSIDNLVFGSGGALLQQMNRDTMKFAMKCSAIKANGEWIDVYKEPITDSVKKSKRGLVNLYQNFYTGEFVTTTAENRPDNWVPAMENVYRNGNSMTQYTLDEIRSRIK